MKNVAKSAGKSMATNMAIGTASSLLGNAIGGVAGSVTRTAGSVGARAASSAMMNTNDMMKTDMTDEKKQAAIATAFSHLSSFYKHNGSE